VQALRHFGRANVLFMDGHVESLGPAQTASPEELEQGKFLDEISLRWRSSGR